MSSSPTHPVILCYDGSPEAARAITYAGEMFRDGPALVVTVWQPGSGLGSLAWSGATDRMENFVTRDRAAAEEAGRLAEEGVRIARRAGMGAKALPIEAAGPVWKTIVEAADEHGAAAVVMGSRGYTPLRAMLLGSVSSAVVHHARQPTLVVHDHGDGVDTATSSVAA
jgi:nucleotide-binding universal stress UspA family protein